jgi:hypothetical protein
MNDILITFLTILAWFVAIISTLAIAVKLFCQLSYNLDRREMDSIRGIRRTYMNNIFILSALCIIAWAWIIAKLIS